MVHTLDPIASCHFDWSNGIPSSKTLVNYIKLLNLLVLDDIGDDDMVSFGDGGYQDNYLKEFSDGQYKDWYCISEDKLLEDMSFPWSVLPHFINHSDADVQFYLPQINHNYMLLFVVGTNSKMDTLPTPYIV